MKTRIFLLFVCLVAVSLTITACRSHDKTKTKTEQNSTAVKVVYTCPMHPEVTSDKPGKCPKCGMDLVIKESTDKNTKMNQDSTEMKEMNK